MAEASEQKPEVQPAKVVAFFSMTGSVGKTRISVGLAEAWAAAGQDVLLIDADLVTAESSRQKEYESWCKCELTSQDLGQGNQRIDQILPLETAPEIHAVTVLPAARWIRTEQRISAASLKYQASIPRDSEGRPILLSPANQAFTDAVEHIHSQRELRAVLRKQLDGAQRAQAEQVFSEWNQEMFWTNVLAIARDGKFSRIIVDFPPFGPGGVGQWGQWRNIKQLAAPDNTASEKRAKVDLQRGFVFATGEPDIDGRPWQELGHPLVQRYKGMACRDGGVDADDSLFVVENFHDTGDKITPVPDYRALQIPWIESSDTAIQPMDRLARRQSEVADILIAVLNKVQESVPDNEKPEIDEASNRYRGMFVASQPVFNQLAEKIDAIDQPQDEESPPADPQDTTG